MKVGYNFGVKEKDFWYYQPFNRLFYILAVIWTIITAILCDFLYHRTETFCRIFLTALYVITLLGFIVYKLFLSKDSEYKEMYYHGEDRFNWFDELPLQLCNINLSLIPIGLIWNLEELIIFAFYFSFAGAMLAILMPCRGFYDCSFLKPRMLGFYLTHYLDAMIPQLLLASRLYTPMYKDCLPAVIILLLLAFIIYLFNTVVRKLGLSDTINYFYVNGDDGNPILVKLYQHIPHYYLYMVPTAIPFFIICLLKVFLFKTVHTIFF